MTIYPKPIHEIIYEVISSMGGSSSINEMYEKIRSKYPKTEIHKNTISTQMSDLAINGPDSSQYTMKKRFLKRIGRGRYQLKTIKISKNTQEIKSPHLQNNKITIMGEPYTFATNGEILWKKTLVKNIPDSDNKKYSGINFQFHIIPSIHTQPLDVDNLCEPVFSILVGKKKYFEGKRKNIQWFKAQKIINSIGKLDFKLSEKKPEILLDSIIFNHIYQGALPTSARDQKFATWIKSRAKETVELSDECKIAIRFETNSVNIGDVAAGKVKPIIDCLYPILGGKAGKPDDHKITTLLVEKGVLSLPKNSVEIIISR